MGLSYLTSLKNVFNPMGHGPLGLWASLIDELTWWWVKPMGLSGDGLLLTMGLSGDKALECLKNYQFLDTDRFLFSKASTLTVS